MNERYMIVRENQHSRAAPPQYLWFSQAGTCYYWLADCRMTFTRDEANEVLLRMWTKGQWPNGLDYVSFDHYLRTEQR